MIGIDFEFKNSNEPHPTLVCAVMGDRHYWLFDGSDNARLKQDIIDHKKEIFLSYYTLAEARCFLALGLDPMEYLNIDLYIAFRMQKNGNNEFEYGPYIDANGLTKVGYPPIKRFEGFNREPVPNNLVNAVYKNLGITISKQEKNEVRDIILKGSNEDIERNKTRILQYCQEDVNYLIPLYEAIHKSFVNLGLRNFDKDLLEFGKYAAANAKCEQLGIPIDSKLLANLIEVIPEILNQSRRQVDKIVPVFKWPELKEPKTFKNGKVHVYKETKVIKDTKAIQAFIASLNIPSWPKTETGAFETSKDVLGSYRQIPLIDALYRHNSTENSLKRFTEGNSEGFFSAMGSDSRVRPFPGILRTQTGRNAYKATSFPFAMSKWLRSIVRPTKGKYIVLLDWVQQEIGVAAALSKDANLIEAYKSGDTYLAFGKQANLIPQNATKQSHAKMRKILKAFKLGLAYGMGQVKLAAGVSAATNEPVDLEFIKSLIDFDKKIYSSYREYILKRSNEYYKGVPAIVPGGWTMFCDNNVVTSVRNYFIQATSASITRKAVINALELNLNVLFQQHDSIAIETDSPDRDTVVLQNAMDLAVRQILGDNYLDIRVDVKVVSSEDIWVEVAEEPEERVIWDLIKPLLRSDVL